MKHIAKMLAILWLAVCFAFSSLLHAGEANSTAGSDSVAGVTETVAATVEEEAGDKISERRKHIMKEAVDALAQTREALQALEENRSEDALDALALVTGKLELIVARDPELALAPTDVSVTTHDIYGTAEAVREAIKTAEAALRRGEVQRARRLLDGIGSELVITVAHLPLAIYPDAIKAVTPLIDDGEFEQAKRGLQAALNTLVLQDYIVPLPVIRSEALLERAEALAESEDRSAEENEELANTLDAVRNQLEMAQLLGYGDKRDYEPLYAQLKEIGKSTADGKSGTGFFDSMKTSMSSLWDSIWA